MIKTIHWIPELREKQAKMLEALPENDREYAEYMFRIGNVASHYYNELEADPTEEDFNEWLTGLPENLAAKFQKDGYEKTKGVISLRRHAAERKDLGMDAYMKDALSEDDYKKWIESGIQN